MRNSARVLVVLSSVPLAGVLAAPALAAGTVPTTAYEAGPGLTVTETLALFVGIPLLIIGVIYVLVYALTGRRGPRYPAGQPWSADPEWFGERPVEAAQVEAGATGEVTGPARGEGGARGQW